MGNGQGSAAPHLQLGPSGSDWDTPTAAGDGMADGAGAQPATPTSASMRLALKRAGVAALASSVLGGARPATPSAAAVQQQPSAAGDGNAGVLREDGPQPGLRSRASVAGVAVALMNGVASPRGVGSGVTFGADVLEQATGSSGMGPGGLRRIFLRALSALRARLAMPGRPKVLCGHPLTPRLAAQLALRYITLCNTNPAMNPGPLIGLGGEGGGGLTTQQGGPFSAVSNARPFTPWANPHIPPPPCGSVATNEELVGGGVGVSVRAKSRMWHEQPLPTLNAVWTALVEVEWKEAADRCFRDYQGRCVYYCTGVCMDPVLCYKDVSKERRVRKKRKDDTLWQVRAPLYCITALSVPSVMLQGGY